MSRYAWLVCEDTKEMLWLGKVVTNEQLGETYLHIGGRTDPPNSRNALLSRAVMKFLAEHIGKTLCVWPEDTFDSQVTEEYVEIGGDGEGDISLEAYSLGYKG
jgi:hypothetical protein